MKKSCLKVTVLFLVVTMITGMFSGCGSKNADNSGGTTQGTSKIASDATNKDAITFPLKQPITLKCWSEHGAGARKVVENLAQSEFYKELEKRTNVKVEFVHPSATAAQQIREQFNIMIASNEIPDVVFGGFRHYPGREMKALEEGIIIDLTELVPKYMPNLMKLYSKYPDLEIENKTRLSDGKFLYVPSMNGSLKARSTSGFMMRKDWLDELSLKEPTSVDEWYNVLKAFKEKKGAKAPFTGDYSTVRQLSGAFKIDIGTSAYYVDSETKKVTYHALDPKFKDFITMVSKWYKEGLIDAEFATNTPATIDANMTNGKAGATFGNVNSALGKYVDAMKKKDPNFKLAGVQYMSLKQGEKPTSMFTDPLFAIHAFTCITVKNKYPKETLAWLDYGFSKEGNMLNNFGMEGTSYKLENGKPKYTDLILKNPDGYPFVDIGTKYFRSYAGPFIREGAQFLDTLTSKEQVDALETWSKFAENKIGLERYGNPPSSETDKIATKATEIKTYMDELQLKLIMGQESVNNMDKHIANLKKMGVDEIIQLYQKAHDDFLKKYPNLKDINKLDLSSYFN